MIKYLKIKFDKSNNTQECFWYLEIDTDKEEVLREVRTDFNNKVIRKAPTNKDNYGVFTDNENVVISPQKSRNKKTIIFNPDEDNTELISKEKFEKMWQREVEVMQKKKRSAAYFFLAVLLIVILIVLFIIF